MSIGRRFNVGSKIDLYNTKESVIDKKLTDKLGSINELVDTVAGITSAATMVATLSNDAKPTTDPTTPTTSGVDSTGGGDATTAGDASTQSATSDSWSITEKAEPSWDTTADIGDIQSKSLENALSDNFSYSKYGAPQEPPVAPERVNVPVDDVEVTWEDLMSPEEVFQDKLDRGYTGDKGQHSPLGTREHVSGSFASSSKHPETITKNYLEGKMKGYTG